MSVCPRNSRRHIPDSACGIGVQASKRPLKHFKYGSFDVIWVWKYFQTWFSQPSVVCRYFPRSFSWDLKRVQRQGLLTGEPPTFWQCGPVRAEKLHWECELPSIHHFFWTAMTQDLPYPTRKSWNEILEHLGKAQSWAADFSRWFLWSYRILINWPCREILKQANRNLQNVKLHQLLNFEMMSTYPKLPKQNKQQGIGLFCWANIFWNLESEENPSWEAVRRRLLLAE